MPTYIHLVNWTEQGIRTVRETVDRSRAVEHMSSQLGGQLKDVYWTVGPYDLVVITEAPDDETATAFLLALGSQGNVRTTTLRGFNEDEMRRIIERVPS